MHFHPISTHRSSPSLAPAPNVDAPITTAFDLLKRDRALDVEQANQVLAELPEALDSWAKSGMLGRLAHIPAALTQQALELLASCSGRAGTALEVLETIARRTDVPARDQERFVFEVFDALRISGQLSGAIRKIERDPERLPLAASLVEYANPQTNKPLILGHRGNPVEHVENTVKGIASAFARGAGGVEVDVNLVMDGKGGYKAVLWHDMEPGGFNSTGFYSWWRNFGLEPRVYAALGFQARPRTPNVWWRSVRKSTYRLEINEFRQNYGYASTARWPGFAEKLDAEIPTLNSVGKFLAKNNHRDKVMFLDLKLPEEHPELWLVMADQIDAFVTKNKLRPENIIIGNGSAEILNVMRDRLGNAYKYSHNALLIGPFAKAHDHSPFDKTQEHDFPVGDVGHVFLGSDSELIKVVRKDSMRMKKAGKTLVLWTINDELVLRKLMGIGGIDMVITDRPAALLREMKKMNAQRHAALLPEESRTP